MVCPVCRTRKAKRQCPALGKTICSVCCGTKRLVEIDCPDTCVHLSAARANPAAPVRRQYEQDVATLLPTIQTLTERQHQLFYLFHTVIARHRPDGFARLADGDVAAAAAAASATLETAAKGVIYEHPVDSPVARKLAGELLAVLGHIRESGATVYDGEAAIALRAVEHGAKAIGEPAGDAYLALMGRLLQVPGRPEPAATAPPGSIIVP